MTDVRYQPHYRQIEQALRERIAAMQPGERAAVRRRAVRRVRGQPDDRPQRDAAAGRGWPDRARAGPRQLRRGGPGPPPGEPADDLHPGDAAARAGPELAGADPGHPAVRRGGGDAPGHPARPAGRPAAAAAAGRRRADRDRDGRPHRRLRRRGDDRRPRARLAARDARPSRVRAPSRNGHDRCGRRDGRGCATPRACGPATRCSSSAGSSRTVTAGGSRRPNRAIRPTATGSTSSSTSRDRTASSETAARVGADR